MKRKLIALLMVCAMLSACTSQTAQTTATVSEPSSSESSSEAVSAPESSEATASTIERIDLAPNEYSGLEGDSFEVSPTVYPETAEAVNLTYSSTNESVVTVDENGSGTLTGVGSAEIVVTDTASGVEARFSVTSQAVPQTSKPTGGTQATSGGTGGTQQQTPSNGGTGSGSGSTHAPGPGVKDGVEGNYMPDGSFVPLPQVSDITDDEFREIYAQQHGGAKDEGEWGSMTVEEQNEVIANRNWAY